MTRFAPLLALLAAACAPATLQTARTNGQGNFQFAVEPGITGVSGGGGTAFGPAFNLSGRYGVTDSIDIGLRLGTCLYELQTKFMFTDPADVEGVALALAPSTTVVSFGASGGGASASVFYWDTRVPLLIGVPVGRSEFTVGPRLRPVLVGGGASSGTGNSGSATAFVLMVGGSVGFAGRAADKFRIMPEFGIDIPVIGAAGASSNGTGTSSASVDYGGLLFTVGLGFLFGGPDT